MIKQNFTHEIVSMILFMCSCVILMNHIVKVSSLSLPARTQHATMSIQTQPIPLVRTITSGTNNIGSYAHASKAVFMGLYGVCSMGDDIFISDANARIIRRIGNDSLIIPFAGVYPNDDSDISNKFINGIPPLEARFKYPTSIACDSLTNSVYVLDMDSIRKITMTEVTTVVQGLDSNLETRGQLSFNEVGGLLYFADTDRNSVRRFKRDGSELSPIMVTTPYGVIQTNSGELFISTQNNVIYKFDGNSLVIYSGTEGKSTPFTNGPISQATWGIPSHLSFDNTNRILHVIDYHFGNYVIRSIKDGEVSTSVGNLNDNKGAKIIDGPAQVVSLTRAKSGFYNSKSNLLLIVDENRLRVFDQIYLTTVSGKDKIFEGFDVPQQYSTFSYSRELISNKNGDIFTLNSKMDVLKFSTNGWVTKYVDVEINPLNIAINNNDEIYIGDLNSIYKVSKSGQVELFAFENYNSDSGTFGVDGVNGKYILGEPYDMAINSAGDIYYTETKYHRIRKFDTKSGIVSTIFGNGIAGYDDWTVNSPTGIVITPNKDGIIFSEAGNHIIRSWSSDDDGAKLIAGQPKVPGYSTGIANNSLIHSPHALFLKGDLLYFSDSGNHLIRMVNLVDGSLNDIASIPGASRSDGTGPRGIVVLENGDIIVSDFENSVIRKVSNGVVSTISAQMGEYRDGPIDQATFYRPENMELLPNGDILIADRKGSTIRKLSNGIVSTIAGTPRRIGFKDRKNAQETSLFQNPTSVRCYQDDIYISDSENGRIRKIDKDGAIHTIVGGSGDGIESLKATATISEIAFTNQDDMLIADPYNGIRKINKKDGIITTIVGNGEWGEGKSSPDGTKVLQANLNSVYSISVCLGETLFFLDTTKFLKEDPYFPLDGQLKYVKGDEIYTIGPAQHISCDKSTDQLVISQYGMIYLLEKDMNSNKFTFKLVSGNSTINSITTSGSPFNQVMFSNPVFTFNPQGDMYVLDLDRVGSMSIVSCDKDGWRMKDLTTCIPTCQKNGKNGICNGNGMCESDKCVCKTSYFGDECEFMYLSSVFAVFQSASIGLNSRPSILLSFNDQDFVKVYNGRKLEIQVNIQNDHPISVIKSIINYQVSSKTYIQVTGPVITDVGSYRASLIIIDMETNIVITESPLFFSNELHVQSNDRGVGNSAYGAAVASSVILALLSIVSLVSLFIVVAFVYRKFKFGKSFNAYELEE